MNLSRFQEAVSKIARELENDSVSKSLQNLIAHLQTSINQPSDEATRAFRTSYQKIFDILEYAKSNNVFPIERKLLDEIGASHFVGLGLRDRIAQIFSENGLTPSNAFTALQQLRKDLDVFQARIKSLADGLGELTLDTEILEPGSFEIGLSLPRPAVGTTTEALEKEFHEINFVMKTFQEVVGEGAGGVDVKTISGSDWQIFLDVAPQLAAGVAIAVERIVALYKNHLDIKKLKKELEDKQLPNEILKKIQEYIDSTVKTAMREIAENIVDEFYKSNDIGRKNELKTQTTQALRYLADRIDRGAIIEVRAEAPLEEDDEDGDADKKISRLRVSEIAASVNKRMTDTAKLARSDQPVLSIGYDKSENQDDKK